MRRQNPPGTRGQNPRGTAMQNPRGYRDGLRFRSCFTVFDGVAPCAIQSFTFAVSTETCFSSFSMGW